MPKVAALTFATLAIDLLISSAAIGVAFFAALRCFRIQPSPRLAILGLLGLFAFLDLVWWPVAALSTATFTIHDPELASFFDLRPDTGAHTAILLRRLRHGVPPGHRYNPFQNRNRKI